MGARNYLSSDATLHRIAPAIHRMLFTLLLLILELSSSPVANAQIGGGYDLTWSSIDAGGGRSEAGAYSLAGTIGQPDAGRSSGAGGYIQTGGFWYAPVYAAYLPVIVRS